MTRRIDALKADPTRFDLMGVLREMERGAPDKPRIGKAAVTAQQIVRLGQDPFLAFPASNIQSVAFEPDSLPEIRAFYLGMFGPQGPLPLLTTVDAYRWKEAGDDSFAEFANIFAERFLQLFYRAWADARPIAHFDRPTEDRFADYVGSFIGIGSPPFKDRDNIPDIAKLDFAGILASRVKSASRLEQVLRGILGVKIKIREREGLWLEFEDNDLTRLGRTGAYLGQNTYAGARVFSINDKAVIEIQTDDLETYKNYLPGAPGFERLANLVGFYLGDTIDFDVELALPKAACPAAQLGEMGQLGWTCWSAPSAGAPGEYVNDATFSLHQAGAQN